MDHIKLSELSDTQIDELRTMLRLCRYSRALVKAFHQIGMCCLAYELGWQRGWSDVSGVGSVDWEPGCGRPHDE